MHTHTHTRTHAHTAPKGPSDPILTVVTAHVGLDHNVTSCVHMNRILWALQQNGRYCSFTWMDPTRAVTWCARAVAPMACVYRAQRPHSSSFALTAQPAVSRSKLLAAKQALALTPCVLFSSSQCPRPDLPILLCPGRSCWP